MWLASPERQPTCPSSSERNSPPSSSILFSTAIFITSHPATITVHHQQDREKTTMAALLRNPFHNGVLTKRSLSPRPLSPKPVVVVDLGDKSTSSHKEHSLAVPLARQQAITTSSSSAAAEQQQHARIRARMPPGSWDGHMHVLDPDNYPLSPHAVYQPSRHTIPQALSFEASIGAAKMVVVQPSVYGTDNACLLDALRVLGPARARGVVALPLGDDDDCSSPPPPLSTLREWHDLGVRGARINLQSTARALARPAMERLLARCAAAVRPLGWAIQLYVPLDMVGALEAVVPRLGVRVCIDHMGAPPSARLSKSNDNDNDNDNPYALEGFAALARLLAAGHVYVKLSAAYRFSDDAAAVEPLAREMLRVAGHSRVLFASDWPHTRFEGLDIRPWVERVMDWCDGDQRLLERVFRGNAEDLWR